MHPEKDVVWQWYEELGGEVVLLGKPAAVLYEEALRMLSLRRVEGFFYPGYAS